MEIKIVVKSLFHQSGMSFYTKIDRDYTFYDLLIFLQSRKTPATDLPYDDSCFKHNNKLIHRSKLNQKL